MITIQTLESGATILMEALEVRESCLMGCHFLLMMAPPAGRGGTPAHLLLWSLHNRDVASSPVTLLGGGEGGNSLEEAGRRPIAAR
jgi:hypothetical protein